LSRPGGELPSGVSALFGEAARRRRELEERLSSHLLADGWEEAVLPVLDYLAPYEPLLGAAGRGELYRFSDADGEPLALRSDFTPMLARLLAPRLPALTLPLRCFYRGDVVRRRQEELGGARELCHLGAELLGVEGPAGDAEAFALFLTLLRRATEAPLRVTLGCAGVLDEMLLAVPQPATAAAALARRDRAALRELAPELLPIAETGLPSAPDRLGVAGQRRLDELRALLAMAATVPGIVARIDLAEPAPQLPPPRGAQVGPSPAPPAVRMAGPVAAADAASGRPYYDGVVFRAWAGDDALAVGAGGRYDGLFAGLGAPVAAVGFALLLDRLLAAEALRTAPRRRAVAGDRGAGAATAGRLVRLALPKGRGLASALAALRAAGLALDGLDPEGRRLWQAFPADGVEVLLLKDWDLPLYVERGVADLGVVGSDVLDELGGDLLRPLRLRDGACRLSLIGPPGELPAPGSVVRVASKYPTTARRALAGYPWSAEVYRLAGSVELAPLLGLADLAFDIVQTGATLREHGLAELAVIQEVNPCLVIGRAAYQLHRPRLDAWMARLEAAEMTT
jgi:ATP phosphoribosyltransferase